jgi:acyl carrier protein
VDTTSLADVVELLEQLSGLEVDPTLTLRELGVDSLELAEWVFTLQERLDIFVDERRLAQLRELPVESIYEELMREAAR